MLVLGFNSLRFRTARFTATFINVFLGAVVLTTFASLLDTAGANGVSADDRTALTTVALAVGGWSLVIVVFGVASTMNLATRQRRDELALLRAAGATPAQTSRLIIGEAAVVAVLAAGVAVPPAMAGGRAIVHALRSTDQISNTVDPAFGPVALVLGPAVTLAATVLAAAISARRTGRISARDALTAPTRDESGITRVRTILGAGFLTLGVGASITTATALRDEGFLALGVAGQAGIAAAIGLALLSPLVLRSVLDDIRRPAGFLTGASGHLAAANVRHRTDQTAAITMPVVVFTALASVSLHTLDIDDRANAVLGRGISADDRGVRTLTFLIVGMIAVFAAIVVVNNVVATMAGRRAEFALARRIGATPGQQLRAAMLETTLAVAVGVGLGTLAAVVGVAGFAHARVGSFRLRSGPGQHLAITAAIVLLTLTANLLSTIRSLGAPLSGERD